MESDVALLCSLRLQHSNVTKKMETMEIVFLLGLWSASTFDTYSSTIDKDAFTISSLSTNETRPWNSPFASFWAPRPF